MTDPHDTLEVDDGILGDPELEYLDIDAPPIPGGHEQGRVFCDWALKAAKDRERLPDGDDSMHRVMRVMPHIHSVEDFDQFMRDEFRMVMHHAPVVNIDLSGYDKPYGVNATREQNRAAHDWMRQQVAQAFLDQLPEQLGLPVHPRSLQKLREAIEAAAEVDPDFHRPVFVECLEFWPYVKDSESLLSYAAQYVHFLGNIGPWGQKPKVVQPAQKTAPAGT